MFYCNNIIIISVSVPNRLQPIKSVSLIWSLIQFELSRMQVLESIMLPYVILTEKFCTAVESSKFTKSLYWSLKVYVILFSYLSFYLCRSLFFLLREVSNLLYSDIPRNLILDVDFLNKSTCSIILTFCSFECLNTKHASYLSNRWHLLFLF